MVCILCDSKTKTTNSRFMRRSGNTWRRHTCPNCHAVFTTREYVDVANSYRLRYADGSIEPLLREKLLLAVVDSLKHRKTFLEDSVALTDTILGHIVAQKRLILDIDEFNSLAASIIRRFDRTGYIKFVSMIDTSSQ